MQTFTLTDDFVDADAERALLAAIACDHDLYWQAVDVLSAEAFVMETDAWQAVSAAITAEQETVVPNDWAPTADPIATAQHLADLHQRRQLAAALEQIAPALYSERPAAEVAQLLEEEASRIQAGLRESQAGQLQWAADLLIDVIADAEERIAQRKLTGQAVMGLPTGLHGLDELLNGLRAGLYTLAAGPGFGKTTLALQFAVQAAERGTPVVYVTYENSPGNLTLKAVCARAKVPTRDVERGFADMGKLSRAANELEPTMKRLALVEGTASLTVPQIRAQALRAMARGGTKECVIVFDYLQQAARSGGFDQMRHNVSALVGDLREMAMRLNSPVIAISSQNRSGGNYGEGKGSASLDSLKESGDVEYAADAVLFLRQSEQRTAMRPARAVDLVVAKNRYGDTGNVPLIFRPDIGLMREEAKA